ncbi:MAG: GntR family transcriptional regulator, partial [Sulfolobaceae archaeon]
MVNSSMKVYEELVKGIVEGRFRLGSVLKEDELAKLFSVSRTPVREALARLEREGLAVKRGKSYMIVPLTAED